MSDEGGAGGAGGSGGRGDGEHGRAMPDFAMVRRLEAVGFRAWPAASVQYDGSWQIRLTAGHPSKRLNSVNPLDPSDHQDLAERIERAGRRFSAYGRPLVFRQSPLAPAALNGHLDRLGWSRFDETAVMIADMRVLELEGALDHLPVRDVGRFVDAVLAVGAREAALKPGLTEVLSSIRPPTGFFVVADAAGPAATALCVHDNDLAGIFELAVRADLRKQGLGRAVVTAALRWARMRGAEKAWLQVETDNEAARALYAGFGFEDVYRYHYRQEPAR